jgi:Flp pilus assembly protein TadG
MTAEVLRLGEAARSTDIEAVQRSGCGLAEARMARHAYPRRRRTGNAGHSVIEIALMAPWIFLAFVALFDFGIYAYAGLATANAARAAALRTSAAPADVADQTLACIQARRELRMLWNVSQATNCTSLPLIVTAAGGTGPDGSPTSRVTVTYQTPQLFPLPFLMGRMTLRRVSEMRVYR